jgi:hypothetical protein
MIGGAGYVVLTAVREARAENRLLSDPSPDERDANTDAKPTPPKNTSLEA